MTAAEVISQHLPPDWTENLPDVETMRVLLDRIMEERNCGLRRAALGIVMNAEDELLAQKVIRPSPTASHIRATARTLIAEGKWRSAVHLIVGSHYGHGTLPRLLNDLDAAAASMGLNPDAVPE